MQHNLVRVDRLGRSGEAGGVARDDRTGIGRGWKSSVLVAPARRIEPGGAEGVGD